MTSPAQVSPNAPAVLQATATPQLAQGTLERARSFARALIETESLDTGENVWQHADAVAAILAGIGGSEEMQAAGYLVYACPHLNKPEEVIAKAFGENLAQLAMQTNQLLHVQRLSRAAASTAQLVDDPKLRPRTCARCCSRFRATCGW